MRDRAPLLAVALLLFLGLGGLLLMGSGAADRRLDRSVIGTAALGPWLQQQGIAVQVSGSRTRPRLSDLGLRILPLYDMNLLELAPDPATRRDAFYMDTQREIEAGVLNLKRRELPTLIALPKWVTGTVGGRIAHRTTLIPVKRYYPLLVQLQVGTLRLIRPTTGIVAADTPLGRVTLFEPQVFDRATRPAACSEVIGLPQGDLLLLCMQAGGEGPMFLLADPDLINNHGLSLGSNAATTAALVRALAGSDGRQVFIDTSGAVTTIDDRETLDEARYYERTLADLSRFFAPPFLGLWAMVVVILAVLLWRGSVRFGPLRPDTDGLPEQSKLAAVATNARLLRINGQDGRILAEFVRMELGTLTQHLFGQGAGSVGLPRLFAHLARRNAAAAQALKTSAEVLMTRGTGLSDAELARQFQQYRSQLEILTHGEHVAARVPHAGRGAAR